MRRLLDLVLIGITFLTVFQTLGYVTLFAQLVRSSVSILWLTSQVGGSTRYLQPAAWWVLFALVPVATRGAMMVRFRQHGSTQLTGPELNREGHRAFILALAGFSFTGLIGLAVLDQALQRRLEVATLYLVISFMAFMFALNMQSYKAHRWQDDLATTATDVAILSMLLSVVAVLFAGAVSVPVKFTAAIGLVVWVIDHWIRLRIEWRYRKEL